MAQPYSEQTPDDPSRSTERLKYLANQLNMKTTDTKSRKTPTLILIVVLLIILSCIAYFWRVELFFETLEVNTQPVEQIQFGPAASSHLRSTGSSHYPDLLQVRVETPETLLKKHIREGDLVRKGQLLLEFDSGYLELQLKQLHTKLLEEQKQKNQLLDKLQIGTVSRSDLDASDFAIEQIEIQISEVQKRRDELIIKAPFDALITALRIDIGERPSGIILEMAPQNQLWIETDIRQEEIPGTHIGDPVMVMFEAAPLREFAAKVHSISPEADYSMGTVTVYVELVNPDPELRSGYTARLFFTEEAIAENRSVYVAAGLPVEVLFCADPESGGLKKLVEIEKKNLDPRRLRCGIWKNVQGIARFQHVELGQRSGRWVEIVEGLKEEDEVIISASGELREGVHLSE